MKSTLKKVAEEECKLELTSMIDVVFLLLIFFLCTLKFKTLEGKLAAYLPKDVGVNTSEAEEIEKVEILIKVVATGTLLDAYGRQPYDPVKGGRFSFGPDRRLSYQVGPRKMSDVTELEQRLRQGDPPVIARCERDRVVVDLRTVSREDEEDLARGLREARASA